MLLFPIQRYRYMKLNIEIFCLSSGKLSEKRLTHLLILVYGIINHHCLNFLFIITYLYKIMFLMW